MFRENTLSNTVSIQMMNCPNSHLWPTVRGFRSPSNIVWDECNLCYNPIPVLRTTQVFKPVTVDASAKKRAYDRQYQKDRLKASKLNVDVQVVRANRKRQERAEAFIEENTGVLHT